MTAEEISFDMPAEDPVTTIESTAEKTIEGWKERGEDVGEVSVADVATRAARLIERAKAGGDPLAGLDDAQKLALAIGLPVPRIITSHLIDHLETNEADRERLRAEAATLSDIVETGCVKIDFYDKKKKGPNVAYLVLDEVPAAHDLGAELDKLYSRISPERHQEIRNHLAVLVNIGRQVYAKIVLENPQFYAPISNQFDFDIRELGIDPSNTTMLGDASWPKRVGIVIKIGPKIGDE